MIRVIRWSLYDTNPNFMHYWGEIPTNCYTFLHCLIPPKRVIEWSLVIFCMIQWLLLIPSCQRRTFSMEHLVIPAISIYSSFQCSGQIIIIHQPGFPWNKWSSLPQLPFGVRSCEVAIIWPEWWTLWSFYRHSPIQNRIPGWRIWIKNQDGNVHCFPGHSSLAALTVSIHHPLGFFLGIIP